MRSSKTCHNGKDGRSDIRVEGLDGFAAMGRCGSRWDRSLVRGLHLYVLHPPARRPRVQRGSSTFRILSAGTFVSVCTVPLGQRISMDDAIFSVPNPKWTRGSLEDMKPTLTAT